MTLAVDGRRPVGEVGGDFDINQYEQTLALAEQLASDAAGEFIGGQPYRVETQDFWLDPTIAASLQHEAYIDRTLDAFELLLRGGRFATKEDVDYWRSECLAEDSLELMASNGLNDILMDIAEADPDSPRSQHIAELLFMKAARTHLRITPNDNRIIDFTRARLPMVLEKANLDAQKRPPSEATEWDEMTHEQKLMAHYGMGVAQVLAAQTGNKSSRKDTFVAIGGMADSNPYAQQSLVQLMDRRDGPDVILQSLGLPAEAFKLAWNHGYGQGKQGVGWTSAEYRIECIRRMLALEASAPGSCKVLYRQFGIRNFARFPMSMLQAMYEERDTPYEHRVYLLSAVGDSNGSSTRGSMPKFEQLRQRLREKGIGMTVVEVGGLREIKVRARQARLGNWPLAAVVISDSHGAADGLDLGPQALAKPDIRSWLGELAASISRSDGVFFIDACSTGSYADGFAGTLSEVANREVLAATGGMYLKSIDIDVDAQGKPRVDVEIGKTELRRFRPRASEILPTAMTGVRQIGSLLVRSLGSPRLRRSR